MTNLFELSIFSLNFDLRRHLNRKNLFATFRNFNVLLLKVLHLITPIRFRYVSYAPTTHLVHLWSIQPRTSVPTFSYLQVNIYRKLGEIVNSTNHEQTCKLVYEQRNIQIIIHWWNQANKSLDV